MVVRAEPAVMAPRGSPTAVAVSAATGRLSLLPLPLPLFMLSRLSIVSVCVCVCVCVSACACVSVCVCVCVPLRGGGWTGGQDRAGGRGGRADTPPPPPPPSSTAPAHSSAPNRRYTQVFPSLLLVLWILCYPTDEVNKRASRCHSPSPSRSHPRLCVFLEDTDPSFASLSYLFLWFRLAHGVCVCACRGVCVFVCVCVFTH